MAPPPLHIALEFARAEQAGSPGGFRFAAQTYLLRTGGGGFESAEFPWSRELLADLRALRADDPPPELAHRIGDVLREFLADAGWSAHEQAIVGALQSGAAVRVTVRSAAAELYALPWELLALKSTGQMLGGIPGLLLHYEWPETRSFPDAVPPARRSGRVLLAWSAAAGSVPAAEHLAAVRRAIPGFDPARDVLPHASFAGLADALAAGPPIDVLHLLCHGAVAGNTFGLALDDPGGGSVVVDAGRVQQLLAPHAGKLRLVVVAACDGGNTGELGNHLGSVAQRIHRAGLLAVLASRFPLSVAGSVALCDALYRELAAGQPLEPAFLAAREALVRDSARLDWASVQLYTRAADGDALRPLTCPAHVAASDPRVVVPPPRPARVPAMGALIVAVLLVVVAVTTAVLAGPFQDPSPPGSPPPTRITQTGPVAAEGTPPRPADPSSPPEDLTPAAIPSTPATESPPVPPIDVKLDAAIRPSCKRIGAADLANRLRVDQQAALADCWQRLKQADIDIDDIDGVELRFTTQVSEKRRQFAVTLAYAHPESQSNRQTDCFRDVARRQTVLRAWCTVHDLPVALTALRGP